MIKEAKNKNIENHSEQALQKWSLSPFPDIPRAPYFQWMIGPRGNSSASDITATIRGAADHSLSLEEDGEEINSPKAIFVHRSKISKSATFAQNTSPKNWNIFHWMIFFVGSSLFQLKHAKLQGTMQTILLSVICAVSGFTPEMPELPDLRCRLEIPSFSRLSQSASSFVARSSWHRGKSLWWKFHIENGGRTKGNQRCSFPRSRRLRA